MMTYWSHSDLIYRWLIFFLVMRRPILKKNLLQSCRLNGDVDTSCNHFCCFYLIFTVPWSIGLGVFVISLVGYWYGRFRWGVKGKEIKPFVAGSRPWQPHNGFWIIPSLNWIEALFLQSFIGWFTEKNTENLCRINIFYYTNCGVLYRVFPTWEKPSQHTWKNIVFLRKKSQ